MRLYSFSEVVSDVTSKFSKITTGGYKVQGKYRIVDQGKEPVAGYTDDSDLVNSVLLPIIIFGDHTRVLKYEDEPLALGADGAKALWVNRNVAIPRYVFYYLRSVQIKEAGYSRHFKFLKQIDIPIPITNDGPDFVRQSQIAHLLGKVEGLVALRKQQLQQLDDLIRSVFVGMFGDPVQNDKGWDKPELQAFGRISTGNTPPRNEPANYDGDFIEWIKTDNIGGDAVFITPAIEHLSKVGAKKARTVTKGALLVACIAGSVESIGRAALTDRTVAFNQQINAIQPNEDVSPLFLYGLFKLSRAYIQSHATKGMKKILTKGDFEKITMIKPPIDLQNQFAAVTEKVEALKFRCQKSLADLESLYGALSQKAFKGELDLSRVQLPHAIEGEDTVASMPLPEQITTPGINLPETELLLAVLEDRAQLGPLIHFWLEAYRAQLGGSFFSLDGFVTAAQIRIAEVHPDADFELRADAYEHIKSWVFEALAARKLVQVFDDVGNRIQVKAAQS